MIWPVPALPASPRPCRWLSVAAAALLTACAAPQQIDGSLGDADTPGAPAAVADMAGKAAPWQRVRLGTGPKAYDFAVYANHALNGDLADIEEIVVVQHGVQRNADAYYAEAATLLAASGRDRAKVLLLAPKFAAGKDKEKGFDNMPLWTAQGWISGENAVEGAGHVSSLQVLDDLVDFATDAARLPSVRRVTVAGHSGGGQLIQRYAVLNRIDERIRARGIDMRYVVANPSSYLYFTPERPEGDHFARYDAAQCPTYNDYRYGLLKLVPYAREAMNPADGLALFERYARRQVAYLAGTSDNNPNHRLLDKSCGAEAQGPTRLQRARAYWRYERYLAGERGGGLPGGHRAFEVIGVGHNQRGMFGSACGQQALFGTVGGGGAACVEGGS